MAAWEPAGRFLKLDSPEPWPEPEPEPEPGAEPVGIAVRAAACKKVLDRLDSADKACKLGKHKRDI